MTPLLRESLRVAGMCCALVSAVPGRALASEEGLDAAPMHDKKIRLDGLLREWPQRVNLTQVTSGSPAKGDPKATVVLGYDHDAVYVAMQVEDAQFVHKKDYAELELAFPSGGAFKTYTVKLEPGSPGKAAGVVSVGGRELPQSKIVEAPTDKGLGLEAKIPWSTFPEATTTRVGLRGAVSYHDFDGGSSVTIATSKHRGSRMPPLTIQGEYALHHALVLAKGLSTRPDQEAFGNVVGDQMKERIAVFDRYLTVTGFNYRGGTEFFYQDLQVQGPNRVKLLQLADFNGDGFDEVVLRRQLGTSGSGQELLEVWQFPSESGGPVLLFQHEVGIIQGDNQVSNDAAVTTIKGKPALLVKATKTAVDIDTWQGVPAGGETKPVLLPWHSVKSRAYAWRGRGFEVVDEKQGKPLMDGPGPQGTRLWSGSAPPPRSGSSVSSSDAGSNDSRSAGEHAPKARPPSADELMNQVYELYRTERGAKKLKPKFDFATNVAMDDTVERVLVHGKDIVVFGKKFLQGRSYAYTTLGVERPDDVLQVTATDVTGDGRAEVVVHGVVRAQASKKLGGDMVNRHAVFIYRVLESGIERIFAAETGRAVGDNMVLAGLKFAPMGKAMQIELLPGRATGWTRESYPFPEDRAPYAGLEPLPLPWTEQPARVYIYTDGKFVPR